jgi:hypothetical protein
MNQDVELSCRCGAVHGWARRVTPNAVHRAVCYCDDCQAYLHYLDRADLLDEHGGTDVVQLPPSMVAFDAGLERIVAVRLSDKGMFRWYADCCKTPLGNTYFPTVPFIGIPVAAFRSLSDPLQLDLAFGRPRVRPMAQFAIGDAPGAVSGFPLLPQLRAIAHVALWKLTGKTWPHPYFERATKAPKYPVKILEPSAREALRPLCGPKPTQSKSG